MKTLLLHAPKQVTIPIGSITPEQIRKLCRVEKLREFEVYPSTGKCKVTQKTSWPYKGKMKKYPKNTNVASITSYATISESMITVHSALHEEKTILAPSGMVFAHDQSGVFLRRLSDGMDFHPQTEDYFRKPFASFVREQMAINFRRRAETRKKEKADKRNKNESAMVEKLFLRDLPNTRVTLADSRQAGNCVEGSLSFAERKLGVSRDEILNGAYLFSLPADRVLKSANGQTDQAMRAVRRAWMRETAVCI